MVCSYLILLPKFAILHLSMPTSDQKGLKKGVSGVKKTNINTKIYQ